MVNPQASLGPPSDNFNLLSIWRTLRKRKLLSLSVAVAVFGGVAAFTYTRPYIYESETLILVDNRQQIPVVQTTESALPSAANLETEIQILKSRSLIGRAIHRLAPPFNILNSTTAADNISISQIGDAGVLRVAYRDTNPERAKAVLTALGATYVEYSLESKRGQADNAIKFIEAKLPRAKKVLNQTAIAIREFRKRYDIPDPDGYATSVAEVQQSLQQRIQDLQINLAQTQRQYSELRAQVGEDPDIALSMTILSQDPTYTRLVSKYKDAEADYVSQRAKFKDAYKPVGDLKKQRDIYLRLLQEQATSVLGSAKVAKLGLKSGAVPALGDSAITGSGGANPPVAPAASAPTPATVASKGEPAPPAAPTSKAPAALPEARSLAAAPVRQTIQQSLASQLLSTQVTLSVQKAQLASLTKAQNDIVARFKKIPQLQQQYTELQRDYNVNSQIVNGLLTKLEELRITEAQETSPWRVLEPPDLPDTPVSPKIDQNLLYGFIASVFLGLGAAFVPDLIDERIKGVEEAKELTGLPLLGAIPKTENLTETLVAPSRDGVVIGDRLVTRQYTRSPFKEALRSLALSLRYLGSNNSVKTLLFTSSIPAEGKSIISYNLGLVLSEFGKRVLVVDADMRKPNLHRFLELPNSRGLSTAIATETPWQQLVQSGGNPNLTLLTSGPIPPNPVALLNSEKMTELLAQWRENFDYVIVDTPPVVGLPDAQSIVSRVDRVVLIVAIERSTRSVIARVLEILRSSQCELAGLVVNMLNDGNEGYYYQYYTSYYGESPPDAAAVAQMQAQNNGNGNGRRRGMLSGLFGNRTGRR
ncbi:GumC family protein [Gloeobacter kilaueensis]|uniref:non-specific protein-tyrosine kinase n=1 Tax=Gloeobacter kilaueensis (strain ATCC BAA-2537 / CCAP 1431/1 / ULC 316 / JS1) TaxID=1183438 RepID=U5QL42_GLOK1|nr:polysaccharide biosynthesis tyrosine autokinase [Gloeobacter kilaueensis]AGY59712.1 capsular exopolysaccharide family [Gloeobacter kilaueensis JS1]